MPRWASRITRCVTGVRVERLQRVKIADIEEMGISVSRYYSDFAERWDVTYACQGYPWASDPLVWIYEIEHNQRA